MASRTANSTPHRLSTPSCGGRFVGLALDPTLPGPTRGQAPGSPVWSEGGDAQIFHHHLYRTRQGSRPYSVMAPSAEAAFVVDSQHRRPEHFIVSNVPAAPGTSCSARPAAVATARLLI